MFQSTRPRGARPAASTTITTRTKFQSTRPRGARPQYHNGEVVPCQVSIHAPARGATFTDSAWVLYRESFNPRAREGRDYVRRERICGFVWFQSTRPRGARPEMNRSTPISRPVSIHAPARGATRQNTIRNTRGDCFNPRAREGRDLYMLM